MNIKILKEVPLKEGKYIKAKRVDFLQNEKLKSWEIVKVHDSVAILIYHKEKRSFVLVKQFRPALYLSHKYKYTYELCAGLVDKDLPLVQIAKEEILEETGYDVNIEDIQKITSFFTSVGFAGSKQTLYYCEVEEKDRVNCGGGVDEEEIEVIFLSIDKIEKFLYDEEKPKTPGLLFAICWWMENKRCNI